MFSGSLLPLAHNDHSRYSWENDSDTCCLCIVCVSRTQMIARVIRGKMMKTLVVYALSVCNLIEIHVVTGFQLLVSVGFHAKRNKFLRFMSIFGCWI